MNKHDLYVRFESELQELYLKQVDSEIRWQKLERLHIIGQQFLLKHFQVHLLMLYQAILDKNFVEFFAQVLRLLLILPGHLFRRLPIGNVGSSRVSAFRAMAIPDDLKKYFEP